ncbi:MAG: hypothetical protein IJ429_02265 [Lachnospiraceae bacterium]|nr:hypothetical protein [Lachnospiraceae bacterium]
MKKIIVVYDDSFKPGKEIRTITGDKTYGETIFKRVTLKNRMKEEIAKNKSVLSMLFLSDGNDGEKLKKDLISATNDPENTSVVYLYSNYGLADTKEFQNLLTKACYINGQYVAVCGEKPAAVLIPDVKGCLGQMELLQSRKVTGDRIETEAFMDLSRLGNFLAFITSGFDARFFNALAGDEYTVTKRSTKIEKIKSEYNFYYLLPENMKMWFVMPYDYKEDKDGASYTMERFHMTDIAIRFVHGAVSTDELADILDKLFYFVKLRKTISVDEKKAAEVATELYLTKLQERMADLKKLPQYAQFDALIGMGTDYDNIDQIVEHYIRLYDKVTKAYPEKEKKLAVGHGDLCFSNILYSREANLLKLIDPKGALVEEDLYTDPYYDLAKLSHSICGCYDFFNSGLYQITMDRDMKIRLSVDTDPQPYMDVFKGYLEKNGYSYTKVRLYEASLFLSMLPYHMDQPGKVFGFILNAIRILEEIEECTKS